MRTFIHSRLLLLGTLCGVVFFLETDHMYTYLVSHNPLQSLIQARDVAAWISLLQLVAVITYWSRVTSRFSYRHALVALLTFLSLVVVLSLGTATEFELDEALKFVVGPRAWWMSLAISVLSFPVTWRLLATVPTATDAARLKMVAIIGMTSLALAIMLYAYAHRGPHETGHMLAKVALGLILPSGCAISIAVHPRWSARPHGLAVRSLLGLFAACVLLTGHFGL